MSITVTKNMLNEYYVDRGVVYMVYLIRSGDTLYTIANKFGLTVEDLLNANVICNPEYIAAGQAIVIPQGTHTLPKAGGTPYYIIQPGDTLSCISGGFNIPVGNLAAVNEINDINLIYPNTELLLVGYIPAPEELQEQWTLAARYCHSLNSLQIHDVFYTGSFLWASLGETAVPYLKYLAENPCDLVRFYSLISLGRIAPVNKDLDEFLKQAAEDQVPWVSSMAGYVQNRIKLAKSGMKRIHVITTENRLYKDANLQSTHIPLPQGTQVVVLKWFLPSPEEGPLGGFTVYDHVQVVDTGQRGFVPRFGYNEITMV